MKHRPSSWARPAWRLLGAVAALLLLAPGAARARQDDLPPGRVTAALARLDRYTQACMARSGVPGVAIAVVYKDKIVYLKGFGVREVGKPGKVDPDTVFQIASMSKPVSGTVVASLVGKGKLSWDDPVVKYDPGFAMPDPAVTPQVTVRDFFCHRSGLNGLVGDDLESIGYDRPGILNHIRYVPLAHPFRSAYDYSNYGITEGAVAAADADGKAWEDAAADELYKPLGMTRTSSRYADLIRHENRAALHVPVGEEPDGRWAARVKRDPDPQAPAGGVSSTARDLAQWVRLELAGGKFNGKQLIAADALAQTHLKEIVRGTNPVYGGPAYYGLGWNVDYDDHGRLFWSHAGAFSQGARTQVHLYPAGDLGIVVLANAFPSGLPEAISYGFYDLVLHGHTTRDWLAFTDGVFNQLWQSYIDAGAPYRTPPAHPAPAGPDSRYVGTYANDYVGDVEVVAKDGGLWLLQGPGKKAYPLRHFDGDTFVYISSPEFLDVYDGVVFTPGPGGTAAGVKISTYAAVGKDALTRAPGGP